MQLSQSCVKFISGYFSTNERTKKTRAAYHSDLAQFRSFAGEDLPLKSVNGTLIERWCAHLRRQGYSPTSIRRKMVALRVFCSYWVRKGSLRESPFWRVKLSYGRVEQLPRALSSREMRKLLSQARKNDSSLDDVWEAPSPSLRASSSEYRSLRNLALVDLLFATGLRDEFVQLPASNVGPRRLDSVLQPLRIDVHALGVGETLTPVREEVLLVCHGMRVFSLELWRTEV